MPKILSAPTNVAAFMIAARGGDIIKEDLLAKSLNIDQNASHGDKIASTSDQDSGPST